MWSMKIRLSPVLKVELGVSLKNRKSHFCLNLRDTLKEQILLGIAGRRGALQAGGGGGGLWMLPCSESWTLQIH